LQDWLKNDSEYQDSFEELKLDQEMDKASRNHRRRAQTEQDDSMYLSPLDPYESFKQYLNSFTSDDLLKDGLFNGENYFIPKSLILLSEQPLFGIIEQILRFIYREWIMGVGYPIEHYLSYLTYYAALPSIGSKITYSFPNGNEFVIK